MLTSSERQELKDLVEIASNLTQKTDDHSMNILIFGQDVTQWPLYRIVQLRSKDDEPAQAKCSMCGQKIQFCYCGPPKGKPSAY